MPTYEVKWLGDPDYGRDDWSDMLDSEEVEAENAVEAAQAVFAAWQKDRPKEHGEGTVLAVREVAPPPPTLTYVASGDGKVHLERGAKA